MIKVEYANIESKIKTNGFLYDPLVLMLVLQRYLLFMLVYNIMAEVLANFLNADKRIKRILIGDQD